VLDMFSCIETALTEGDIFTANTFINSTFLIDLFKLASITVIIVADAYFFTVNAFLNFIFLNLDYSQIFISFYISAERAFNDTIIFDLIFHPLRETIQMKSVATNVCASCCGITFNDLHVAYCA